MDTEPTALSIIFITLMVTVTCIGCVGEDHDHDDDHHDMYTLSYAEDEANASYVVSVKKDPLKTYKLEDVYIKIDIAIEFKNDLGKQQVVWEPHSDYSLLNYTKTIEFPFQYPMIGGENVSDEPLRNLSMSVTFSDNDNDGYLSKGDTADLRITENETAYHLPMYSFHYLDKDGFMVGTSPLNRPEVGGVESKTLESP